MLNMIKRRHTAQRRIKHTSHAGFTMIEIIVVITIIAVFAAIAGPSMLGIVKHGKQVNRMNVARTIYLAAQNQLIKSALEKNLKSTLTGYYYKTDIGGAYTDELDPYKIGTSNVSAKLGGNFPGEDSANAGYVQYISKPKGYTPTGAKDELNDFYNLLDAIIVDKSILNDAILMEYNIKTGVVMSIFYGDMLEENQAFGYGDESDSARYNVTGGRGGESGYQYAEDRYQGYYGVGSTGQTPLIKFQMADIVSIYDGTDKPLDIGGGEEKVNVLYAEMLLAKQYKSDGTETAIPEYTFELINANSLGSIISVTAELGALGFPTNFRESFGSLRGGEAIYRDTVTPVTVEQDGVDVSGYYERYIWIIDYIEGDTINGQPQSISEKVKDAGGQIEPQNIRIKAAKGNGPGTISLSLANTHFNSELGGGEYEIKSARHLNNIRYKPDGKYRQTADIDMMLAGNEITNFAPIAGVGGESFSGEYYAMKTSSSQYKIINLKINTAQSNANVGLFASVSGTGRGIQGVSLYKAVIEATGGGNVGAIAGVLSGGAITQSNSYANITISGGGAVNAGGLVGYIQSGSLDQSFNAGFYNASINSATANGFGSVTAGSGNIGGLAGLNRGTIQNSFNNARVNVSDVSVTADGESLSYGPVFASLSGRASMGGIAGHNDGGTIKNTYVTNHISQLADYGSTYGGISGSNGGSGTLQENYFLAGTCAGEAGSDGSEAVSKAALRENPCGAMFAKSGNSISSNLYIGYDYPTLKNNNPFSDPDYDWEKYPCGWEDIQDVRDSETGLLYYELYDGGTLGFSGDGFQPLAQSGSAKLVINDGYALDIGYTSSAITVTIGSQTNTLMITNPTTPSYTWSGATADIASIVRYAADGTGEARFLLFFDNAFLEGRASGEAYIDFIVRVSGDHIISTTFNPLFADTAGKMTGNFSVRSPRHVDNINKVLDASYTQELNLDFDIYRKTATFTTASSGTVTGSKFDYLGFNYGSGKAVVSGAFAGEYNGNSLYMEKVEAKYGIFEGIGLGGEVKNITLQNSKLELSYADGIVGVGGIAAGNSGVINGCIIKMGTSILGSTYRSYIGGIVGKNDGRVSGCVLENGVISGASYIGGIAGENTGAINNCKIAAQSTDDIKISGGHSGSGYVGGISGANGVNGEISDCMAEKAAISGADYIGGIAGKNDGRINDCALKKDTVSGVGHIGGIAGESASSGAISVCVVENTTVSGMSYIGGIAGESGNTITGCMVVSSEILANNGSNAGGITGSNSGHVLKSGVMYSVISSNNNNIGGITGNNNASGMIEDVFFLSANNLDETPVVAPSWSVFGGIAGINTGGVSHAFYLAPAPKKTNGSVTTIYPIVGSGTAAAKNNAFETCFYLEGDSYSLNEGTTWVSANYNRDANLTISGGGKGLATSYIDTAWLQSNYQAVLSNWYQPSAGYPYPMIAGITAPDRWPRTDSSSGYAATWGNNAEVATDVYF